MSLRIAPSLLLALFTSSLFTVGCSGVPSGDGDGDGDGQDDDDDDDDDDDGGDGDGDGDGDGPSLSDEEVASVCQAFVQGDWRLWTIAFSAGQRCEPDAPVLGEGYEETQAAIDEFALAQCAPGTYVHDEFKALLSGGRIAYDPADLIACRTEGRAWLSTVTHAQYVEASASAPDDIDDVEPPFAIPSACETALAPKGELNSECRYNFECKAPTLCRMSSSDFSFRCLEAVPLGGACLTSSGASCQEGATCVANLSDEELPIGSYSVARLGVCAPLAKVGESCAEIDCVDALECDEETLLCVEGEPSEETAPVALGAVCFTEPTDLDEELDRLSCETVCATCRPEQPGATTYRCLPSGEIGDGCESDSNCLVGFTCIDGACAHPLAQGEPCLDDEGFELVCAADLVCHSVSGTCAPPTADGGPCSTSSDCATDLVCIDDACQGARSNGSACESDGDCLSDTCVNDVCASGEHGSACAYSSDCSDGACAIGDLDEVGTCVARPAAGAACIDGLCVADAYCSEADVCSPRAVIGGFCNEGTPCMAGLLCAEQTCVEAAPVVLAFGCSGCLGSDAIPALLFFSGAFFAPRALRRRRRST